MTATHIKLDESRCWCCKERKKWRCVDTKRVRRVMKLALKTGGARRQHGTRGG